MGKGRKNKFRERSSSSLERISKDLDIRSAYKERLIVFSLKDFDRNQGQGFFDWEGEKLLALAVSKLQSISGLTRREATQQQIVKEYPQGIFPPDSDFYHPRHISADIAWCSMHIQGKECVIGYFEDIIFHIEFLDKEQRFWKSGNKNT